MLDNTTLRQSLGQLFGRHLELGDGANLVIGTVQLQPQHSTPCVLILTRGIPRRRAIFKVKQRIKCKYTN